MVLTEVAPRAKSIPKYFKVNNLLWKSYRNFEFHGMNMKLEKAIGLHLNNFLENSSSFSFKKN